MKYFCLLAITLLLSGCEPPELSIYPVSLLRLFGPNQIEKLDLKELKGLYVQADYRNRPAGLVTLENSRALFSSRTRLTTNVDLAREHRTIANISAAFKMGDRMFVEYVVPTAFGFLRPRYALAELQFTTERLVFVPLEYDKLLLESAGIRMQPRHSEFSKYAFVEVNNRNLDPAVFIEKLQEGKKISLFAMQPTGRLNVENFARNHKIRMRAVGDFELRLGNICVKSIAPPRSELAEAQEVSF